jgi:hypothetical protein
LGCIIRTAGDTEMTEDNFELRNGWLEADVVMQAVDESPRAKARAAR